jgi:hypothetical protein
MDENDEITEAKHSGELDARAFDLHLRDLESREREDRLTRLVAERPDLTAAPEAPTWPAAAQVDQLHRQVALLTEYQRAVVRSRGWRVVQFLRRLLGRAW